jgi:histidine triad (HIT) family protein
VLPRQDGFDLRFHARSMADHALLAEHAARVRAALEES